jgi:hypothetical protein
MSRACVKNKDEVIYICAEIKFSSREPAFIPGIKRAYFLYFLCKVGNHDKM